MQETKKRSNKQPRDNINHNAKKHYIHMYRLTDSMKEEIQTIALIKTYLKINIPTLKYYPRNFLQHKQQTKEEKEEKKKRFEENGKKYFDTNKHVL